MGLWWRSWIDPRQCCNLTLGLVVGGSLPPQPAIGVGVHWLSIISPRQGSVGVVFDGGRCQLAAVLGAASGCHGVHIT